MLFENKHPDFPIDWHDLYERICDEEIIVEFALSFIRNGEKLVGSLKGAVSAGDPEQIELYAHALKGSASNIGAIRLAKAAWQLEKAAAEKHTENAVAQLEKVNSEFIALKTLLDQPDWIRQAQDAANKSEAAQAARI